MLFRLHNGSLISLNDNLIGLSEWLESIQEDVQPMCLLAEAIKKSPYKRVKALYIHAVEEMFRGSVGDEELKGLSNPESKLSVELKAKFTDQPEQEMLEGALEYTHTNIDTIFDPVIHHIKFLKDETLTSVIEFLQIPCTRRSDDMFEGLPFLMQGCPPGTDLKTIADPSLHSYIDFIRKIDGEPLMDLAKAACLLGIKALTVLVGCRLAAFVSELNEKQLRQKFAIPEKFRDSVMEKLRSLLKEQAWVKTSATGSAVTDNVAQAIDPPPAALLTNDPMEEEEEE